MDAPCLHRYSPNLLLPIAQKVEYRHPTSTGAACYPFKLVEEPEHVCFQRSVAIR
jgi:hypothetical protein